MTTETRSHVGRWLLLGLLLALPALLLWPDAAPAPQWGEPAAAVAAQALTTPTASVTPTYPPEQVLSGKQIRTAYGVDQLSVMGAGKIVAIIDSPGTNTSDPQNLQRDLCNFSAANDLPVVALTVVHVPSLVPTQTPSPTPSPTGTLGPTPTATPLCAPTPTPIGPGGPTPTRTTTPSVGTNETTLDVQAVHAMAPLAQKIVVFNPLNGPGDLATAVTYIKQLTPGPNVISMSVFTSPGASGPPNPDPFVGPIVSVASSGDAGHDTTNRPAGKSFAEEQYPQENPNVVAVGGTTLFVVPGSTGSYVTEYAWTCPPPIPNPAVGLEQGCSGGGLSPHYGVPTYQTASVPTYVPTPTGVPSGTPGVPRMVPDVSIEADCNTGLFLYHNGIASNTAVNCGTSLAAPLWAGILALAVPPGTSSQQVLNGLYALARDPAAYAANFHDVTNGSNGPCTSPPAPAEVCRAQVGYDLVTGLGSPKANSLVPTLMALLEGTPFPSTTPTAGPSATPTRTATATIHPLTQTAIALTGTPTPTIHPLTQTAIAATATIQALTATATPTIHPLTQTAIVQTATIQALTATATPTIHPLTQTAVAATATIQALTATATPTIHPLTQTALALTPTATSTPVRAPTTAPNGPLAGGTPGVPAATTVGQTVQYSSGSNPNGVNGVWHKTGSGVFAFTATNTSAAIVPGSIPALTLPTTAGNESGTPLAGAATVCSPVGAAPPFTTTCQGTTVGDVLLGAPVTVAFALAGGGTAVSTGQQVAGAAVSTGPAAPAPPPTQSLAAALPLLPPPPPLFIPPPPAPLLPAPRGGPPAAAGIPLIPETDSALLLAGGLLVLSGIAAYRRAGRR